MARQRKAKLKPPPGRGPKILAIGGAVIKAGCRDELKELADLGEIRMLVHNGGSIYHDFQLAVQPELESEPSRSVPLDSLITGGFRANEASERVWAFLRGQPAVPAASLTAHCLQHKIPVLMFTTPGADFWHLVDTQWELLGATMRRDFNQLCKALDLLAQYVCMGSAVIHPEVFIKAVAFNGHPPARADVVDFLDMYRPRTRIARFGHYYKMEHRDYVRLWLDQIKPGRKARTAAAKRSADQGGAS